MEETTNDESHSIKDSKSQDVIFNNVERASKIIAWSLALLYLLGFLVVLMHTSRYGIATVDWGRPYYILAGSWLAIPPLIFLPNSYFWGRNKWSSHFESFAVYILTHGGALLVVFLAISATFYTLYIQVFHMNMVAEDRSH